MSKIVMSATLLPCRSPFTPLLVCTYLVISFKWVAMAEEPETSLRVSVMEAAHLRDTQVMGTQDPYVEVKVRQQTVCRASSVNQSALVC